MAITFPTTLDSFSNPIGTDLLENATTALDHDVQHSNANDAIEALEAKVGVDGSAVQTSHDYKLSGVATGDKAVSKTGTETLTNKTLTAPQINFGSDATGDIIYRAATGVTSRLAIGATNTILSVSSSGVPEWIANPSASDASTTVKGVSEQATSAEITAGTATGATGAKLFISPDQLAGSAPTFSGANLTNLPASDYQVFTASGTWTKPAGLTGNELVVIQIWGGGGSGGSTYAAAANAGGGGGGAYSQAVIKASELGATETVTIGAGGAVANSASGNVGGNSSFGTRVLAYGGGGGVANNAGVAGGGGGGGTNAAGATGSTTSGGDGGAPLGTTESTFGGGKGGGTASGTANGSIYGGGGGGRADSASSAQNAGGNSVYGGGGGGGAQATGGGGGLSTVGAGGSSRAGGAGGSGKANVPGTAGTAPGGGGGGSANNSAIVGAAENSGAGARGECRVWVIKS